MTKSIQNQPSNNDCITSPFEGGKSAFADAGDVITKNKKHLLTLTTLSFFLCLFISSCSKTSTNPSSNYPTYSESGKNVFAFKFNGIEFINCNKGTWSASGIDCSYSKLEKRVYFQMNNDCNQSTQNLEVVVYENATNSVGDTMFIKPENNYKFQLVDENQKIWALKVKTKLWIVFTKYDLTNNICAGRFGGTVLDTSKAVIEITDGFFDYKPSYQLQ